MTASKNYDQKCHDLAVHFYTDMPPRSRTITEESEQVESLAQCIQDAVENWFRTEWNAADELARPQDAGTAVTAGQQSER